jgi:signal recognition particle subunit SRP54
MIELDGDNTVFEKNHSRVIRVARGSGTSVHEVEEILGQYTKFADMVKTMGGKNGLMQNMPTDPRKMNPNQMAQMGQMQQKMANLIPPHMLAQMGGMEGLQKTARQFGNMFGKGGGGAPGMGGGMPNMDEMMKAFGNFK